MKVNQITQESRFDRRDAYQRDYDSSVSGMGRGADHRGLGQELAHERNNIQIAINGQPWKVVAGQGTADSAEERSYLESMKQWAERKSASSGKTWTVYLTGAEVSEDATNSQITEFATAPGGDSGDYFQALASAWYNGTFDSGSLEKGIKSQQDVERLLQRGIVCPDGVTRKYGIDYNSDFDGVVISSDDYYEHADHDETDSRTGKPFGPYDYMEFGGEELDESAKWRDPKYKDQLYTQEKPDYNDSREYDNAMWYPKPKGYKGRKEPMAGGEFPRTDPLVKGFGRYGVGEPVSKGPRKGLPSRDQITSLKGSIKDAHGKHHKPNLPEQGVAEGSDRIAANKQDRLDALENKLIAKGYTRTKDPDRREYQYKWTKDGAPTYVVNYRFGSNGYAEFWKEQGVTEGLNEFAPPGSDDGGDDGFSEETLKRLAAQWYNGDEDPGVERTLMAAGWEIGQDEGYDNGGVFVVQSGDEHGRSYLSWPAEELQQGVAEGKPREKEADYGADYQDMVARVKKLAGMGPLKTVYDPNKRVYRNVPTAVQPPKK